MCAQFQAVTSQTEALRSNEFQSTPFFFSQHPFKIGVAHCVLQLIGLCVLCLSVILLSFAPAHAADQRLNINTASPALLAQRLPGIGPAKAKAIVIYREQNGPFKKLDALTDVKGIGPRTLEKIRSLLFVDLNELTPSSATGSDATNAIDPQSVLHQEKKARTAVRAAVSIARQFGAD